VAVECGGLGARLEKMKIFQANAEERQDAESEARLGSPHQYQRISTDANEIRGERLERDLLRKGLLFVDE
jgi:hypothetical protein